MIYFCMIMVLRESMPKIELNERGNIFLFVKESSEKVLQRGGGVVCWPILVSEKKQHP